MGTLYDTHYLYSVIFIFEGRIIMNENDSKKEDKGRNIIEIIIPSNGVTSEAKSASTSSKTDTSNMDSNTNDDNSKEEQPSNQSNVSDSSNDSTQKKEQIIINISH